MSLQKVPEEESSEFDLPSTEYKWPAWKVILFVVLVCGAFWSGVGYLGYLGSKLFFG